MKVFRQPKQKQKSAPPLEEFPRLIADQLFAGTQQVIIEHNGESYFLRITKNGKLILTK